MLLSDKFEEGAELAYQRVAESLRQSIDSGFFSESSRLPSERELAAVHMVSRPTVRAALMALQAQAYIEIKVGSGAYVVARPMRKVTPQFNLGETLEEYIEARVLIEGVAIVQALPHISRKVLLKLQANLAGMKAAIDAGSSPVEHDREFHLTIAKATNNAVLLNVVSHLFDSRHRPLHSALTNYSDSGSNWLMAHAEHVQILQALENCDVVMAQTAIRHHIHASGDRWVSFNLTDGV